MIISRRKWTLLLRKVWHSLTDFRDDAQTHLLKIYEILVVVRESIHVHGGPG